MAAMGFKGWKGRSAKCRVSGILFPSLSPVQTKHTPDLFIYLFLIFVCVCLRMRVRASACLTIDSHAIS